MPEYRVRWEIDVEGDSKIDAARYARRVQSDPNSIAHVYGVAEVEGTTDVDWSLADEIDLDETDASQLDRFVALQSGDKIDLELTCTWCGKVLCDIEAGDLLSTLASVAADHECGETES